MCATACSSSRPPICVDACCSSSSSSHLRHCQLQQQLPPVLLPAPAGISLCGFRHSSSFDCALASGLGSWQWTLPDSLRLCRQRPELCSPEGRQAQVAWNLLEALSFVSGPAWVPLREPPLAMSLQWVLFVLSRQGPLICLQAWRGACLHEVPLSGAPQAGRVPPPPSQAQQYCPQLCLQP